MSRATRSLLFPACSTASIWKGSWSPSMPPAASGPSVQALQAAGGDYVLALKGILHRKVKAVFDDAERGVVAPTVKDRCETVERNGGRRERCRCTVLGGSSLGASVADSKEWPDLCSLIRVQAERIGSRGRRQRFGRHCILCTPLILMSG